MSEITTRFVSAFFRMPDCVNSLGVSGRGIFVHYEYQPWMGLRFLNVCETEDDEPIITFSGEIVDGIGQISADREWDAKGLADVKKALRSPDGVWVEFLRPEEMPDCVPEAIKSAFTVGVNDEDENRIKQQICEGIIERLP